MIKIALPKGRLGDKAYSLLKRAGYGCESYNPESRRLVFCDKSSGVTYFWVKPADVPAYVSLGAADAGVAGKDVLDEIRPDVYELCDFNIGKCFMCVAAKTGFKDDFSKPLRVATKFVSAAENYFLKKGRDIRVVKLNGSIELAPVLGISDVIFDIVETGETLKQNGLEVLEKAYPVSARLIVNKAAYGFDNQKINGLCKKIKGVLSYD